jgi:hypothetical protein
MTWKINRRRTHKSTREGTLDFKVRGRWANLALP